MHGLSWRYSVTMLRKDVWEVSEENFPASESLESQLSFMRPNAIMAPSTHNSQPGAF